MKMLHSPPPGEASRRGLPDSLRKQTGGRGPAHEVLQPAEEAT